MKHLFVLGIVAILMTWSAVASATVFLHEDFEGPLVDWWHVDGDLWHVEDYRSNSATHSLAYNWGDPWYNYYTLGANYGIAWSAAVDVTGASEVYLDFASWLQTENGVDQDTYDYDTAHVEIYDVNRNYAFTFQPDVNYFAHSTWNMLYTNDFKPLLDVHGLSQFRVGFYFDTVDFMDNMHEGWYIDDVTIHDGQTPPPVPEPSTWMLLSTGLLGMVPIARRKFRR